MGLFDFFRTKKKTAHPHAAAVASSNSSSASSAASSAATLATKPTAHQHNGPLRRAIAVLPYDNFEYFSQTLSGIYQQTIHGEPIQKYYDIYVFHDALQARHEGKSRTSYNKIKELALNTVGSQFYLQQTTNKGTAFQFDFAEKYLFQEKQYDFVIPLEHDFVMGPNYLEVLTKLADQFRDDERVATISVHSGKAHLLSQEEQEQRKHEYVLMDHDWGAGLYKRSWEQRQPILESYYRLFAGLPFEERSNLLIQEWQRFLGFKVGATSQDYVKRCTITALKQLAIAPCINLGKYIGAQGMNWNQKLYEESGYNRSLIYEGQFGEATPLSDEKYSELFEAQCQFCLADGALFNFDDFAKRVASNDLHLNILENLSSVNITQSDVVSAYRIFLNRFPENEGVAQPWIGAPLDKIFTSFILSEEFLNRSQFWPSLVKAAQIVIEKNKAKQAGSVADKAS